MKPQSSLSSKHPQAGARAFAAFWACRWSLQRWRTVTILDSAAPRPPQLTRKALGADSASRQVVLHDDADPKTRFSLHELHELGRSGGSC